MFSIGESDPRYIPSSILAKKIQVYNERAKKLIPYLQKDCCTHIIDSEVQMPQA